jgi:hypothetical protein
MDVPLVSSDCYGVLIVDGAWQRIPESGGLRSPYFVFDLL